MTTGFLTRVLAWGAGLAALLLLMALLTGDEGLSAAGAVRWLALALTFAAFPAGVSMAASFTRHRELRGRILVSTVLGSLAVGLAVFVLAGWAAPALHPAVEPSSMTVFELWPVVREPGGDWQSLNRLFWYGFQPFIRAVQCCILGLLGLTIGSWARWGIPAPFRQTLLWGAGFGLVMIDYLVWENTFELIVLRVQGELAVAAFLPLVFPLGLLCGLLLPTLAILRRDALPPEEQASA